MYYVAMHDYWPQYTANVSPMEINDMSLSWVNKLSYLGVVKLS